MSAVSLRPPLAYRCVTVDAALVQEEILMYFHERCEETDRAPGSLVQVLMLRHWGLMFETDFSRSFPARKGE